MNPTISVIIPIYNRGKYVAEAIESILDQTYQDFELILVNDGSTDNSAQICQEYVEKDARITYLEQENAGVSVARNAGLAIAKGKFLYFFDSDDKLDKEFLRTSIHLAQKGDADLLVCGQYYENRFPNPMALPTCATFVKKAFLDRYPEIVFPAGIQPCEDGLFSHQILALTDKLALNRDAHYFYRQHDEQNTANNWKFTEKILTQIPQWFQVLENFYNNQQLWDKKALHIARFMEHEPFESRYKQLPFDAEQKQLLHSLIKGFMEKHVMAHIKPADKEQLSQVFLGFLEAKDAKDYDEWYADFVRSNKWKLKVMHLLSKLLPSRASKRSFRQKIQRKYGA